MALKRHSDEDLLKRLREFEVKPPRGNARNSNQEWVGNLGARQEAPQDVKQLYDLSEFETVIWPLCI